MSDTHLNGLIKRHNALSPSAQARVDWKKKVAIFTTLMQSRNDTETSSGICICECAVCVCVCVGMGRTKKGAKSKRLLAFSFNQLSSRSFPRLLVAEPWDGVRVCLFVFVSVCEGVPVCECVCVAQTNTKPLLASAYVLAKGENIC